MIDLIQWIGLTIAAVVSLLTLYNAARLRSGIIAMSTYAFGGGMLCITAASFLLVMPYGINFDSVMIMYRFLFLAGFILLGWGSWQIYKMSQIK